MRGTRWFSTGVWFLIGGGIGIGCVAMRGGGRPQIEFPLPIEPVATMSAAAPSASIDLTMSESEIDLFGRLMNSDTMSAPFIKSLETKEACDFIVLLGELARDCAGETPTFVLAPH